MIEINELDLSEKQKNILKVLRVIVNSGKVQSSDIKNATNLSVSTISRVISLLKQKNLLKESGKERIAKGRFPQLLVFNFDYGHLMHLDINPDGISGIVSNLSGTAIREENIYFEDNELTLEFLIKAIKKVRNKLTQGLNLRMLAAGISLPGVVDNEKRIVSRIPDIFAFDNIDVFSIAEEILKVPVIINNVPGVAAVGERISNHPECCDLVYLNVERKIGIGAGILINGRLLKGKDNLAGEVGDFYFERDVFSKESSKSTGRMEKSAGLGVLFDKAKEIAKIGKAANLESFLKDNDGCVTLNMIERSIDSGDKNLENIYNDVIKAWAILVINIVLLLNPEIIIIGGAVNSSNRKTETIINEILRKELFVEQRVLMSMSGRNAVFAGGLNMLKSYVFNEIISHAATE